MSQESYGVLHYSGNVYKRVSSGDVESGRDLLSVFYSGRRGSLMSCTYLQHTVIIEMVMVTLGTNCLVGYGDLRDELSTLLISCLYTSLSGVQRVVSVTLSIPNLSLDGWRVSVGKLEVNSYFNTTGLCVWNKRQEVSNTEPLLVQDFYGTEGWGSVSPSEVFSVQETTEDGVQEVRVYIGQSEQECRKEFSTGHYQSPHRSPDLSRLDQTVRDGVVGLPNVYTRCKTSTRELTSERSLIRNCLLGRSDTASVTVANPTPYRRSSIINAVSQQILPPTQRLQLLQTPLLSRVRRNDETERRGFRRSPVFIAIRENDKLSCLLDSTTTSPFSHCTSE